MFATILGSLPRPPLPGDAAPTDLLEAIVRAQEVAGLEPISDAGFGVGDTPLERWRATAALTDRPVKAVMLGPSTGGLAVDAIAALRGELVALAEAGCPLIEIHEPAATGIGSDAAARARFREAHERLLEGVSGVHVSLAITGGNADAVGFETLMGAPYASLAVDLIAGPDNWRLVAAAPGAVGVICGALSPERDSDDRVEILLWAADYAASTGARGPSRVGVATASSLARLPWEVAIRKLAVLGEAARLAELPRDQRAAAVDPRALDLRSAALGRYVPPLSPRGSRDRRR
jgi:hypothetical protein